MHNGFSKNHAIASIIIVIEMAPGENLDFRAETTSPGNFAAALKRVEWVNRVIIAPID